MSKGFSFAQIGGVLGKDPESRATPNGTKVTNFSVAVEKGFGDSKKTSWFNVVAFKDLADWSAQYLKKGKSVIVSGDLQVKSWDDKQTGQKRTSTEVVAFKIDFGDSGPRSDGDKPTRQTTAPVRQQAEAPVRSTAPVNEDPFGDEPF